MVKRGKHPCLLDKKKKKKSVRVTRPLISDNGPFLLRTTAVKEHL